MNLILSLRPELLNPYIFRFLPISGQNCFGSRGDEVDFSPVAANKNFYRTREVVEVFQVSDRMVKKWCENDKITALHTPGGECGVFPLFSLLIWKKSRIFRRLSKRSMNGLKNKLTIKFCNFFYINIKVNHPLTPLRRYSIHGPPYLGHPWPWPQGRGNSL
jgi:hypothetical protein